MPMNSPSRSREMLNKFLRGTGQLVRDPTHNKRLDRMSSQTDTTRRISARAHSKAALLLVATTWSDVRPRRLSNSIRCWWARRQPVLDRSTVFSRERESSASVNKSRNCRTPREERESRGDSKDRIDATSNAFYIFLQDYVYTRIRWDLCAINNRGSADNRLFPEGNNGAARCRKCHAGKWSCVKFVHTDHYGFFLFFP